MPAVGGGPSPERWSRMSKSEKTVYWILVGAAIVFVGYLLAERLWS